GAAERVELAWILHGAQRLDDAKRRNEVGTTVRQCLPAGVRQVRRLEADTAGQQARELAGHVALRLHDLDPRDRTRRLDVPEVGEEPNVALLYEQCAVRAREADEVDDVRRVGDEQRLFEALLQA